MNTGVAAFSFLPGAPSALCRQSPQSLVFIGDSAVVERDRVRQLLHGAAGESGQALAGRIAIGSRSAFHWIAP